MAGVRESLGNRPAPSDSYASWHEPAEDDGREAAAAATRPFTTFLGLLGA